MKIYRFSVFVSVVLFALSMQTASAQVIINFGTANVSSIPFSSGLTWGIAILLGLMGAFFIHRRGRSGLAVLVGAVALTAVTASVVYSPKSFAMLYNKYSLLVSGQEVPDADNNEVAYMSPAPVCGPVGFVWVTSGVGNIVITGINYAPGYAALDPTNPPAQTSPLPLPNAPAPLCAVGTQLDASSSCVVWYQRPGPC